MGNGAVDEQDETQSRHEHPYSEMSEEVLHLYAVPFIGTICFFPMEIGISVNFTSMVNGTLMALLKVPRNLNSFSGVQFSMFVPHIRLNT